MDLFNLMAKLSLDSNGFEKGVKNAEKGGKALAQGMERSFNKIAKLAKTVFSGYVVKTVTSNIWKMANSTAAFGDAIDKQSQALNMSRKAYQQWDYILGQNGASIEDMNTAIRIMNSLILDAGDDSEEAKKAFDELGVSLDLLKSMPIEHQFNYLVQTFQSMPEGPQKTALAIKVFGRNAQTLLPTLNQTTESMWALRDETEKYGLIMSDEAVNASVKFGDSLDKLKRTFTAFKNHIVVQILPTITNGLDRLSEYIVRVRSAFDADGFKGAWEELKKVFNEELKASATSFSSLLGITDESGNVLDSWSGIGSKLASKLLEKVKVGAMIAKLLTFTARNAASTVQEIVKVITDPQVIEGLADAAKQMVDAAITILSDPKTWEAIKEILSNIVNGLLELIQKNPLIGAFVTMWGFNKLGGTFGFGGGGGFGGVSIGGRRGGGLGTLALLAGAAASYSSLYNEIHDNEGGNKDSDADKILGKGALTGTLGTWGVGNAISTRIAGKGLFGTLGATGAGALMANAATVGALTAAVFDEFNNPGNGTVSQGRKWLGNNGFKGLSDNLAKTFQIITGETAPIVENGTPAYSVIKRSDYEKLSKENQNSKLEKLLEFLDGTQKLTVTQMAEKLGIQKIAAMTPEDYAKRYHVDIEEAKKKIDEAKKKLEELPEETDVNVNINYRFLGGAGGSYGNYIVQDEVGYRSPQERKTAGHAKGLWSVPYDNYIARLHRGERVLTASQARHGEGGVNTNEVVQAVKEAVSELVGSLTITLNKKIVGRVMGDTVSSRVHDNINFANNQRAYAHGR